MSKIATKQRVTQANGHSPATLIPLKRDGIHYLNENKLPQIRTSDIALDADGVFKKDHILLDKCRKIAFEVFGSDVGYKNGFKYTINDQIGAKLGTVRGYNSNTEPIEAIVAVNRLTAEHNSSFMGISFANLSPSQAFKRILSRENAADILDGLRIKYLEDSDRQRIAEMFHFYHVDPGLYKHPSMARFMVEVPGSTKAVMSLYRHCEENDKKLSVVTDTPNQDTLIRHLEAVGFKRHMIDELNRGLVMVTQADVTNRKPHPEGLSKVKRDGKGLLYVGDTIRDGQAAQNAKEALNTPHIEFAAVLSGGSKMDALKAYDPVIIANDIGSIAKHVLRATA
jgi:beta-phosphoglucomutase-like phosphatase (HAD superfamily)